VEVSLEMHALRFKQASMSSGRIVGHNGVPQNDAISACPVTHPMAAAEVSIPQGAGKPHHRPDFFPRDETRI
jgi:hypothetical protein